MMGISLMTTSPTCNGGVAARDSIVVPSRKRGDCAPDRRSRPLQPGGAVRFVLAFGAPERPRLSLEHTASSRGDGGPEALARLQSAFRE
jgi:hypothetical protein